MSDELLYSIRILIIHPTLASEEITAALNLQPRMAKTVGQPRQTPKGQTMGGVWPDTRWSTWETRSGDRYFFKCLDKLLDRFSEHRTFLHRIVETGGEINFLVELPGQSNIGDMLTERTVAKLADLKGSLGAEVFPDANPMKEERIWADDP